MTYRANKIRTRLIERLSEEWTVELDPRPWASPWHDNRSFFPEFDDAIFDPRPGYEQDRSKYDH